MMGEAKANSMETYGSVSLFLDNHEDSLSVYNLQRTPLGDG